MTPCSQGRCATMLRYVPNAKLIIEDRKGRNKDKLELHDKFDTKCTP